MIAKILKDSYKEDIRKERNLQKMGIRRRGLGLVVSSPSGAGKSSLVRRLCEGDSRLQASVSVTTRPKREGEKEGVDYYFIDETRYDAMVSSGELLEHAAVFGCGYGTPKSMVDQRLASGEDVIFDIDWQGHRQLKASMGSDLVSIFLLPPSMKELRRRLEGRRSDEKEVIERRMSTAVGEIIHAGEYDWVLENGDIDKIVEFARMIIASERARYTRNLAEQDNVDRLLREGS